MKWPQWALDKGLWWRCPYCGAGRGQYCLVPSGQLYLNGYDSHLARKEQTLRFNSPYQIQRQAINRERV